MPFRVPSGTAYELLPVSLRDGYSRKNRRWFGFPPPLIGDTVSVSLHTYIANRVHVVFAAKDHRELVPESLLPELWAMICGICRNLEIKTYAVGGTRDHVHIFLGLPGTIPLSTAVQKIKANSSRFLHERGTRGFAWQEGFGAFSVGVNQTDATIQYIRGQMTHHRKRDFRAEFVSMLAKHGLELHNDGRVVCRP